MKKYLYILRGLPGSGKSSLAELLAPPINICTADDYFMKDGKYVWDAKKIGKAHEWCQERVKERMRNSSSPIVVANTATRANEMDAYYKLAEMFGYTVFSIIVENRHGGMNSHGVPEETIEKMKKRFDIKL